MIVMKFGGSSVASAAAIRRVISIVSSRLKRQPAVIVSAMGDTTDQLSSIIKHAAGGHSYLAWKQIKELRERHFQIAEELLGTQEMQSVDNHLRTAFRNLHVRMAEVCDGERPLTPEERDYALSIGEQLSSIIVSAALRQFGIPCRHLDSRRLVITDDQFTSATPCYWQSYARIRRAVPLAAKHGAVVMGGFIGSTERGQTTTLGRGGSDLTATIVGAAVNAEEIEIWKDVDGILTADPRLKKDALLVKSLSYQEASELAKAGAKVLHPETIAPAQRLRIPIIMRNTFQPEAEGSSITGSSRSRIAKSIVCKMGIRLLELSSADEQVLKTIVGPKIKNVQQLGMSDSVLYLALNSADHQHDFVDYAAGCYAVHMRTDQALISVIGDGLSDNRETSDRIADSLRRFEVLMLPSASPEGPVRFVVAQASCQECLSDLHELLFADPDTQTFAKCREYQIDVSSDRRLVQPKDRRSRLQRALTLVGGMLTHESA